MARLVRAAAVVAGALVLFLQCTDRFAFGTTLDARLAALFGTLLGVSFYWSATRRHRRRGTQRGWALYVNAALCGFGMATVVAVVSSVSANDPLSATLGDVATFAAIDAAAMAGMVAAMHQGRHRRSGHRRHRRASPSAPAADATSLR